MSSHPASADGYDQIHATAPVANLGKGSAGRSLSVLMMGGESFQVPISSDSNVGDLQASICKANSCGFCITLLSCGQELNDVSASLPEEEEIQCIIESPDDLCVAAQRVLQKTAYTAARKGYDMSHLHLGLCRALGMFDGIKWKEPIKSFVRIYDDDEDEYENICYTVFELTLIDGSGKHIRLIGVISDGPRDRRGTGFFGSIYLRPSLKQIGQLHSLRDGSCASKWVFKDQSWYKAHAAPLPTCEMERCGGGNHAKTNLQMHLAHALASATSDDSAWNNVPDYGSDE